MFGSRARGQYLRKPLPNPKQNYPVPSEYPSSAPVSRTADSKVGGPGFDDGPKKPPPGAQRSKSATPTSTPTTQFFPSDREGKKQRTTGSTPSSSRNVASREQKVAAGQEEDFPEAQARVQWREYDSYLKPEDIKRGERWIVILKPDELRSKFAPDLYQKLILSQSLCACEKLILKDVHRTFPTHPLFAAADAPGRVVLLQVLKAYSVYDMDVGYSQGMAFIAAFLILHIPNEERVFWCLVQLMFAPQYNLRTLFSEDCAGLKAALVTFEQCVASHLPTLAAHLRANRVDCSMYATQWLITVYTYRNTSTIIDHIWDAWLSRGMVALFQTGMALLQHWQADLLTMSFEEIVPRLNSPIDVPTAVIDDGASIDIISQQYLTKLLTGHIPQVRLPGAGPP